jgi:hypothetical protein
MFAYSGAWWLFLKKTGKRPLRHAGLAERSNKPSVSRVTRAPRLGTTCLAKRMSFEQPAVLCRHVFLFFLKTATQPRLYQAIFKSPLHLETSLGYNSVGESFTVR